MAPWSRPIPHHIANFISYDGDTGRFTRVESKQPWMMGTDPAHAGQGGYLFISFERRAYAASRLAWFLFHGEDPGHYFVDHINGDVTDNRIANLRLATHQQNNQNSRVSAGRSGVVGVHQRAGRFGVRIKVDGVRQNLGTFATLAEASKVYAEACAKLHGSFARVHRP